MITWSSGGWDVMIGQVFSHGANRDDDGDVAKGEDCEGQYPGGHEEAENEDAIDRILW